MKRGTQSQRERHFTHPLYSDFRDAQKVADNDIGALDQTLNQMGDESEVHSPILPRSTSDSYCPGVQDKNRAQEISINVGDGQFVNDTCRKTRFGNYAT